MTVVSILDMCQGTFPTEKPFFLQNPLTIKYFEQSHVGHSDSPILTLLAR